MTTWASGLGAVAISLSQAAQTCHSLAPTVLRRSFTRPDVHASRSNFKDRVEALRTPAVRCACSVFATAAKALGGTGGNWTLGTRLVAINNDGAQLSLRPIIVLFIPAAPSLCWRRRRECGPTHPLAVSPAGYNCRKARGRLAVIPSTRGIVRSTPFTWSYNGQTSNRTGRASAMTIP